MAGYRGRVPPPTNPPRPPVDWTIEAAVEKHLRRRERTERRPLRALERAAEAEARAFKEMTWRSHQQELALRRTARRAAQAALVCGAAAVALRGGLAVAATALAIAALTNAGGCWLRSLRLGQRVHSPPVEASAAMATFSRQQTARRGRLWAALEAERAARSQLG